MEELDNGEGGVAVLWPVHAEGDWDVFGPAADGPLVDTEFTADLSVGPALLAKFDRPGLYGRERRGGEPVFEAWGHL